MSPDQRHQRGMSLLELLAAIFIFAIAVAGMFKIIGENGRHTEQLELRYLAQLSANNALVELRLQPAWPAVGRHSRLVMMGGREFSLTQTVEATDHPQIRKVQVSVGLDAESPLTELQAFIGQQL